MPLDAIPIWLIFVGTIALVLLTIEVGYRGGRAARRVSDDEKESTVSAIAATILGLTAFMLAFTFGIVSDRYAERRSLVREDAVAIRTAWHRTDLLPEVDRVQAGALLREYLGLRIEFAQARDLDAEHVRRALARTSVLQAGLWELVIANVRQGMNSDYAGLLITSLNGMSAIHAQRVAIGIQARVPLEIWGVLLSLASLGMASMGYQTGIAGSKRSHARLTLALSFSLVITLIASLDRPDSGVITVSQQPLIDLRDEMGAAGA